MKQKFCMCIISTHAIHYKNFIITEMYVAYQSALGTIRPPIQWVPGLKCLSYEDYILCIVYCIYMKIFKMVRSVNI